MIDKKRQQRSKKKPSFEGKERTDNNEFKKQGDIAHRAAFNGCYEKKT
jgi:hypothetical protein